MITILLLILLFLYLLQLLLFCFYYLFDVIITTKKFDIYVRQIVIAISNIMRFIIFFIAVKKKPLQPEKSGDYEYIIIIINVFI